MTQYASISASLPSGTYSCTYLLAFGDYTRVPRSRGASTVREYALLMMEGSGSKRDQYLSQ